MAPIAFPVYALCFAGVRVPYLTISATLELKKEASETRMTTNKVKKGNVKLSL
jgi:hypothetical protein